MEDNEYSGPRKSRLWLISLTLHLLVLGALVLVPAKQYFENDFDSPEKKTKDIMQRGQELEEIMEDVRDLTAERLARKVALLDAGSERMATNFETMNEFYQPLEDQQRESAMARMDLYVERTLGNMKKLSEQLTRADGMKNVEKIIATLEGSDQLGSRILVGQEELRRGLMFLAPDDQDLVELQKKAEENQLQAISHRGWAFGTLRNVVSTRESIAEAEENAPKLREDIKVKSRKIAELEKQLQASNEKRRTLDRTIRDIRRDDSKKDRLAEVQKEKDDITKRLDTNNDELQNLKRERRETERSLDNLLKRLEQDRQRLPEREKGWQKNLEVAKFTQTAAFNNQKEVVNTLYQDAGREPIFTDE